MRFQSCPREPDGRAVKDGSIANAKLGWLPEAKIDRGLRIKSAHKKREKFDDDSLFVGCRLAIRRTFSLSELQLPTLKR